MAYEFLIARKQMLHRKGQGFISLISFISVAGIAVGVMALIVVLSVMSGFDRELKAKIIGANPHILVVAAGGVSDTEKVIQTIESLEIPSIVSIAPYVEGQVIIRSASNASGAVVKGLSSVDNSVDGIDSYVRDGAIENIFSLHSVVLEEEETSLGGIALGFQLARTLGVGVGDTITVISPHLEEKSVLLPRRAKTQQFVVVSVIEFGMNSMDSSVALVRFQAAQELFNLEDRASGIAIRIKNEFKAQELKKIIQQAIGYPFWTQTWIDMNRTFFAALKVEKNVMAVLLFLIILVAGFNIISTLIMVVMEKTRDIGILKALGATNGSIMRIFLMQGTVVGIVGVGVGTALGVLFTLNINKIANFLEETIGLEVFPSDIYYFNEIPTELNSHDVIIIVVVALLISLCAGLYPARRAAKLNPVETLRYE